MSYSTSAIAERLVEILDGVTSMGSAQIGAPESVSKRLSGYVSMGSTGVIRKATGITQRETRFFVMLMYRVDGDEGAAEMALMNAVDALLQDIQDDLTLGGVVNSTEISSAAADEPDYQLRAGREYREYPIALTVTQQSTYEVIP